LVLEDDDKKKTGAIRLPVVKIIKLDTLAVPTQHAMSAKTKVELILPSLSLEKKGGRISSNSYLFENGRFGRMGREVSAFIIITTGKHAGSVLVYHHLSVHKDVILAGLCCSFG